MDRAAPELLARFDELADIVADADRKLVFGCPAYLVGGHMFFGVHATGLFVKLPADAAAALLAAGGVPFEPMPGRAMGGFFVLPAALPGPEQWVRRSYEYALTLPAKKAKVATKAKANKS